MVSRNVRLSTYSIVLLGMASSLNWASWQNSISVSVLFLANLGKMSFITYDKSTIDYSVCDYDFYRIGRNENNKTSVNFFFSQLFSQMSCTVHVVALCLKKIWNVKESINNTVLIEQLSNEMNPFQKTYINWQIYLDPRKMKSVLLINCYWGSSGRAKTSLHFFLPTTLETVISRITNCKLIYQPPNTSKEMESELPWASCSQQGSCQLAFVPRYQLLVGAHCCICPMTQRRKKRLNLNN